MKVLITITSVRQDDTDTAQMQYTVGGFLRQCENSFELSYREPAGEEGLGNTLTSLRVFADKLELDRCGDYRCLLTMETGCRHESDYDTPLGRLVLTTDTDAYHTSLCPDGSGEVDVSYTLFAAGGSAHHRLHITVKPA